jgi:hypothetical protein
MGQMFAVVTFRRSGQVADPCDFTDEELPGYWADVRTVAKTIERAYLPCQSTAEPLATPYRTYTHGLSCRNGPYFLAPPSGAPLQ